MQRNSPPEVFFGKGVLKIYSLFSGEHPRQSVISVKLGSNFTEITVQQRYTPVNFLYIVRTPLYRSSRPKLFLGKSVLKIDSKFTGEHPCQSTRIFFFYKKPSKGPSSISFLFEVQILVLKVS